jgi:hypothetical protein
MKTEPKQQRRQQRPRLFKEQAEEQDTQPHESLDTQFEKISNLMTEINKRLDEIENENK